MHSELHIEDTVLINKSVETNIIQKLEQIAGEIAQREGCRLYDLELIGQGKGRVLRVFIDKDAGIGVDDCANVSRGLNEVLDANEDLIDGSYSLEVSSPGVDRELNRSWHFDSQIGKDISFKIKNNLASYGPVEKRWEMAKKFDAELLAVNGDVIQIRLQGGSEVTLSLNEIEKAKVVFKLETNKPKKLGSQKK